MSGMIDVFVPAEQEGTRAVVRAWLKQVGEAVALDDPLVELETDKVTQEVSAPGAGVLAEILIASDGEAVPGALLGRIRVGEATRLDTVSMVAEVVQKTVANQQDEGRLSPSVKRAVRVHNIDPSAIAGSGRGGRLTRADVDAFVAAGAGT